MKYKLWHQFTDEDLEEWDDEQILQLANFLHNYSTFRLFGADVADESKYEYTLFERVTDDE